MGPPHGPPRLGCRFTWERHVSCAPALEIVEDLKRPCPMKRLLQGDVGCGKTIVALEAASIAIVNGFQVGLMVPTEILAEQHSTLVVKKVDNPQMFGVAEIDADGFIKKVEEKISKENSFKEVIENLQARIKS